MKTVFFDNCPIIPNIEFINIKSDAAVTICFGRPALIKNKIGLKKIPPPIPTVPEKNPKIPPIKIEKKLGIFL